MICRSHLYNIIHNNHTHRHGVVKILIGSFIIQSVNKKIYYRLIQRLVFNISGWKAIKNFVPLSE